MQADDARLTAMSFATTGTGHEPESASQVLKRLDWRSNARPAQTRGGQPCAAVATPKCTPCHDPRTDGVNAATSSPCGEPHATRKPEPLSEADPAR